MKPWHRRLWAIEFRGADGKRVLIGNLWHDIRREWYDGEPTRALLFKSRESARKWCAAQYVKYEEVKHWRFRPVRVVESVRRV